MSKQTRPFWEDTLRDVCRQWGLWKELLLAKENPQPQKRFLLLPEALGGQYNLQNLCRTLHHSEVRGLTPTDTAEPHYTDSRTLIHNADPDCQDLLTMLK